MKPLFRICKNGACGLSITGLEKEDHQYSSTLTDDYGVFRYTDTVSITVITPVDYKENEGDYIWEVKEHLDTDITDVTVMQFPQDGLHKITRLVLPTLQWLQEFTNAGFDPYSIYDYIYVYDKGAIYKVFENTMTQVSLLEPISLNPTMCSTAFYDSQYTFCTCRLQECFYGHAQDYLNNVCSRCSEDKESIRNRDIIWITMNTIQYLLDLGRYFEAQKILETINGCTGLCTNNNKTKIGGSDCGCSK